MNINWAVTAGFVLDWAIKIAFLLYIPRKRKPSSAIAWLLVIFLLPFIGIILFVIIGSPKLSRKRRRIQQQVDDLISQNTKKMPNEFGSLNTAQKNRIESIVDLNRSLGKLPSKAGNKIKVLPDYNIAIDDLVSEIKKSKEFVHLEYFILALDETTQPLFEAMAAAVKRGVKVRVMFDFMGHRAYPRKREMKKLLTSIGVDWHMMLPFKISLNQYNRIDLRNHRKILVVDDRVAYIGSQNLIDRTYHRKDKIYYDELVIKINGPLVRHCAAIFAGDWYAETGEKLTKLINPKFRPLPAAAGDVVTQLVPSGPGYDTLNNSKLFVSLFHKAQNKIVITNPYFVPDEAILDAVTSAAHRGVDVSIINSEAMDQLIVGHAERSYYQELMAAGIKIYLYKKPILLHSKHITIDDDIAVIGSSNMDIRSFELDLECTVVAYSKSVVRDLAKVQQKNIARSIKVNPKTWHQRPFRHKLLDSVSRLTSALQ